MNNTREAQQKTIERLLIAAIAMVMVCGLLSPVLIAYWIVPAQIERYIEPPAATPAATPETLPDKLEQWTPEQLEDEAASYREALQIIADEQTRRNPTGYNPTEWEVIPEKIEE